MRRRRVSAAEAKSHPPATLGGRMRVLVLAALLATGCGAGSDAERITWKAVQRLVDAEHRAQGPLTDALPTASVGDDRRYVLRAPERRTLLWPWRRLEGVAEASTFASSELLPREIRAATALFLMPRVKIGSTWSEPEPHVVRIARFPDYTSVRLEVPIPANPERRPVILTVPYYAIDLVKLDRIETAPLLIPDRARLEFATGLVEARWGPDPVEFSLLACEQQRCEPLFSETFDPQGSEGAGWRDHRVDLGPLAGQTRYFRFLARRLSKRGVFSFPVWANPTVYAPDADASHGRNVILLSIDTLRADHLEAYGYRHETAPFVHERFARGGTLFENVVAAATITTPSHASMFTALSPATHGTVDGMKTLPSGIATLAEWLRHDRFETAAITENGWLSSTHGFARGFDSFVENRSPDIMEPMGQVDVTFEQASRWLRRHRDKRFFLFLHTFQVHTPYAPPERYTELFAEHEDGPIGADSPTHLRWMADYDREIRYTDDELRRLFETVDELDLGDDTVFILTSDHGESFLEHGVLEHGTRMDEEAVRVPLMLWGRGVPRGRRVATPVGHVDVLPTILELAGAPGPRHHEGTSLVGLMRGEEPPAELAQRPLYSESRGAIELGADRRMQRFEPPAFLVRVGPRKLARYRTPEGFRYEYYDLSRDPEEKQDLYSSDPAAAADLVELLDGYEERGLELRQRIQRGEPSETQTPLLDPDQEQKLRALGYLE
jgi:arylsulfatase A-like enzyme